MNIGILPVLLFRALPTGAPRVYSSQGYEDDATSEPEGLGWEELRNNCHTAKILHLAYKGSVRQSEPEGTPNDVR
jgi:hypothetical protein